MLIAPCCCCMLSLLVELAKANQVLMCKCTQPGIDLTFTSQTSDVTGRVEQLWFDSPFCCTKCIIASMCCTWLSVPHAMFDYACLYISQLHSCTLLLPSRWCCAERVARHQTPHWVANTIANNIGQGCSYPCMHVSEFLSFRTKWILSRARFQLQKLVRPLMTPSWLLASSI